MKKIFIILAIFFSQAQIKASIVDNNSMYQAYLDNDMQKWGKELKAYVKHDSLKLEDKLEISNYLYGYIATILHTAKEEEIDWWFEIWDKFLEELEHGGYDNSETHVFRSAWHAYQYTMHPAKLYHATRSLREADKALDLDSSNALALSLKGNIKFYMPKIVGGSKKDAAEYYEKSIKQFEKNKNILYRWNEMATKLCLAQTYEKLGETEKAIKYCKEILSKEPNFKYMRDEYLPMLIINYE